MGHSKHTLEYTLPVFPSERRKLANELTEQQIIMHLFGPKEQEMEDADNEYQFRKEMEERVFEEQMNNFFENNYNI